jgi:hypothetical protein
MGLTGTVLIPAKLSHYLCSLQAKECKRKVRKGNKTSEGFLQVRPMD